MTDKYTQKEIEKRAKENSDFYFVYDLPCCDVLHPFCCPYHCNTVGCTLVIEVKELEESYYW